MRSSRAETAPGHDIGVAQENLAVPFLAHFAEYHLPVPRGGRQLIALGGIRDGGNRPRVGDKVLHEVVTDTIPDGYQSFHGAGQPVLPGG